MLVFCYVCKQLIVGARLTYVGKEYQTAYLQGNKSVAIIFNTQLILASI